MQRILFVFCFFLHTVIANAQSAAINTDGSNADASAMLDVSDSLALDCNRLANASSVSIELDKTKLEGYAAVLELAAQSMTARDDVSRDPMDWVLYGGEDHSLLATFPQGSEIPRGFKVIGSVLKRGTAAVTLGGVVLEAKGWDSVSS